MTAPSGSSCCESRPEDVILPKLKIRRVGSAVSANLTDTNKLPVDSELVEIVKKQGWISDEYLHLWRRDEGGSAALTSHGILSLSRSSSMVEKLLTLYQHSCCKLRETASLSARCRWSIENDIAVVACTSQMSIST